MATEALVARVKQLVALARAGKLDEAYAGYRALFGSDEFLRYPAKEQRQAIRLVVNAKIPPNLPPPSLVEAHRAAIPPLEELIGAEGEPADFELLGICCVFTGDPERAAAMFRAGLRIERGRNPGSDLCGSLMKWVAAV
jgi:hypothetical protein